MRHSNHGRWELPGQYARWVCPGITPDGNVTAPEQFSGRPPNPRRMASWTVCNFECADVAAREALMDYFEREHPVEFPADRYSVLAAVDAGRGRTAADFAWVGRYLYVTTRSAGRDLLFDTMGRWERAAVGEFDAESGTAEEVTLVLDADAGDDDEVAGGRFGGVDGLGGMDVLYSLAMVHQFRFRSYAGVPPVGHRGPHPDAFAVVDAVEAFVADMAEATGVEPTDEGRAFLRTDPADDDRYEFAETYGPVDHDFEEAPAGRLDDEGADPREGLPAPEDALASDDWPSSDDEGRPEGMVGRLMRLLGR